MPRPRSFFSLSSLLLLALVGLLVAGLTQADRAIARGDQWQADYQAARAAALAEGFLAVHAEALAAFDGLWTTAGTPPDSARFAALAASLGDHLGDFRQIWYSDSAGHVLYDVATGGAGVRRGAGGRPGVVPRGLDVDTLTQLDVHEDARRVRATRRTQLAGRGPLSPGVPGLVVLSPVIVGGQFAGFVGGTLDSAAFARSLIAGDPKGDARGAITVLAGADTVASIHGTDTGARHGRFHLQLPDGVSSWMIDVDYGSHGALKRVGLWSAGLALVLVFGAWLTYQRRQAERMEERNAELERLSAELLRANKSKSEFLANVSHELRTPLNAIVGFADLLRDGVYGELNPRQAGPVQRIEASAGHLRHLVDQVLDLAKMAAGRLEVHTEILDLRPFVFDVATEVEPLVNEKGLHVSLAIPASLPRVRTDPTHLRQILVNLLGNAVKYTKEGNVTVRARLVGPADAIGRSWRHHFDPGAPPTVTSHHEGLWVALQVVDTGIGIARADQERIFEEFEQVGAGPRGDSMNRGTGLGLPISRRLARLIGGDVLLASEPGRGSTFTLWLPVRRADIRPTGATREQPAVAIS